MGHPVRAAMRRSLVALRRITERRLCGACDRLLRSAVWLLHARRRLRRGSCERLPLLVIVSVVLEESAELIGDVVKRSDGYVRYTTTDMEARCEIERLPAPAHTASPVGVRRADATPWCACRCAQALRIRWFRAARFAVRTMRSARVFSVLASLIHRSVFRLVDGGNAS